MYLVPSTQAYQFTRSDGGYEVVNLLFWNGGLVTEHLGVVAHENAHKEVLCQEWPNGRLLFVERERLKEYGPPGQPKMPEPIIHFNYCLPKTQAAQERADKAGE